MLGVPKPVEHWSGFGRPVVKSLLDYGEEAEDYGKRRVPTQLVQETVL